MQIGTGILLPLLTSVLLVLSFPPHDLGFLSWFALVPLFQSMEGRGARGAFGVSFLSGIVFLMGNFYWINLVRNFRPSHFLLLGVYLGMYYGLFGATVRFLCRDRKFPRVWVAPAIWVTFEYIRSNAGFLGLPWGLLGHTQHRHLPVIQIASITGVYGVSFLIVMVNVGICEAGKYIFPACRKEGNRVDGATVPWLSVLCAGMALCAALAYGWAVLSRQDHAKGVDVTVIQGNIPQDVRWNSMSRPAHIRKHVELTREAMKRTPASLVVWPESVVQPGIAFEMQPVLQMVSENRVPLLLGAAQRPKIGSQIPPGNYYNSALYLTPDAAGGKRYDKIILLPFAEYVPWRGQIPWPSGMVAGSSAFLPGKEITVFDIGVSRFGVAICWESIFPDLFRRFVKNGAQFMVNITNEAWFGEGAAQYQFLAMNVFRAVENRVSLVRSANTGVSCFIEPSGRVGGRIAHDGKDVSIEGYLTRTVSLAGDKTFYTLHGDVFAVCVIAVLAGMVVLEVFRFFRDGAHAGAG